MATAFTSNKAASNKVPKVNTIIVQISNKVKGGLKNGAMIL